MPTTADQTLAGGLLRAAEILAMLEPADAEHLVVRNGAVGDLRVLASEMERLEQRKADLVAAAKGVADELENLHVFLEDEQRDIIPYDPGVAGEMYEWAQKLKRIVERLRVVPDKANRTTGKPANPTAP